MVALSQALFEANLAALVKAQPAFVQRLRQCEPIDVSAAKNGEATCEIHFGGTTRRVHSAHDPGREAQRIASQVPADCRRVLLVGAGLGHTVAELNKRGDVTMFVLEPELRFMRTMFGLFDLRHAINNRRLWFVVADDSDITVLNELRKSEVFELAHPALGDLYADRSRHARFLARVSGAKGRVLAVHNKLFIHDLVELLEERQYAVRIVNPGDVTVERFAQWCRSLQPTFLFSINFSPALALLSTKHGIPYVSWTIDPLPASRLRVIDGTDVTRVLAYAHRRATVDLLRGAGLDNVHYLPLAASPKRRPIDDAQALTPWRCNVSFAGSSLRVDYDALILRLTQLGASDAVLDRLVGWLEMTYRDSAHHHAFSGVEANEVPAWLLDFEGAEPLEIADRINGALSHQLRLERVKACAGVDIHCYGDDGWESCGTLYRGRAEHRDGLTKLYNASRVNLDLPRIYQRDIVTMRAFDVMLCGGLLLAEPGEQLLELFRDGEHLITYTDTASMLAAIEQAISEPEHAAEIAEAGRNETHRAHRMEHRLETLLGGLNALLSQTTGSAGPGSPTAS